MNLCTPDYKSVLELLSRRTGLTFTPEGRRAAEHGIRRAMQRARIDDPGHYHALIATGELPLDDVVDELTVGETYFFREPDQFRFIREEILPEIGRRRGPGHSIRIWSAGCASGEEAYSLAMVCDEERLADRSSVLATDISQEALDKAGRASYGTWSLRGQGAAVASRYLLRSGTRFEVAEAIRRRVRFARLNLAGGPYPPAASGMDLILCRNVLIYLDRDAIRRVVSALHEALSDGGWLITASTDPPLGDIAPLLRVVTEHGVFYRRAIAGAATAAAPPRPPRPAMTSPIVSTRTRRKEPAPAPTVPMPDADDSGVESEIGRIRALADRDLVLAEQACTAAISGHPLSFELHHLQSVLLLALGRPVDAARAVRRALYLEPSSVVALLLLGAISKQRGDSSGARRAYRNARALCDAHPAEAVVPHSDGEEFGRLAAVAQAAMARLDERAGREP